MNDSKERLEITSCRFKDILNRKKVSQQDLADISGVNKASISQYLHGKNIPSSISAVKMARVLRCRPEWLMGFDVSEEPDIPAVPHGTAELIELYSRVDATTQQAVINLLRSCVPGHNAPHTPQ